MFNLGVEPIRRKDWKEEHMCLNLTLENKGMLHELLEEYFLPLKQYIPHYSKMHSNCWHSTNIKSLPDYLRLKVKDVYSYKNITKQFPEPQLQEILSSVLGKDNFSFSDYPTGMPFCLPSVYLIGIPKCGTSLLYSYVASHPLFAKPRWKEGQFWRDYVRTSGRRYKELDVLIYLYHFHDASNILIKNHRKFTMDASASTVYGTLQYDDDIEKDICAIPFLLHYLLPQTKILIILRNPVERLWSDYWFFCSYYSWRVNDIYKVPVHIPAIASELFHNLSRAAVEKFNTCIMKGENIFYCSIIESSIPGQHAACSNVRLGLSMYYFHLIKWFNIFPRNQIQVIRLEDLSSSLTSNMNTVWDFIGVDRITLTEETKNKNQWISKPLYKTKFILWPETKQMLTNFLSPYNIKLSNLLNNDKQYLWND